VKEYSITNQIACTRIMMLFWVHCTQFSGRIFLWFKQWRLLFRWWQLRTRFTWDWGHGLRRAG